MEEDEKNYLPSHSFFLFRWGKGTETLMQVPREHWWGGFKVAILKMATTKDTVFIRFCICTTTTIFNNNYVLISKQSGFISTYRKAKIHLFRRIFSTGNRISTWQFLSSARWLHLLAKHWGIFKNLYVPPLVLFQKERFRTKFTVVITGDIIYHASTFCISRILCKSCSAP